MIMEGKYSEAEAAEEEAFLRLVPTEWRLRFCIGFAAFSAWINLLFCFEGLLRDAIEEGGGVVHDPFFVAAVAVAALLLLFTALRSAPGVADNRHVHEEVLRRKTLLVALVGALAGAVGVALGSFVWQDLIWVRAGAFVCGAGAGVFVAAYTQLWGRVLGNLDMRDVMVALCGAFCIQWLPFLVMEALGPVLRVALAAPLPLVTYGCLRGLPLAQESSRSLSPRGGDGPGTSVGRIAGAMFCFALVIQVVWTFHLASPTEPLDASLFWLVFLCVLVFTSVAMAGAIAFMAWRRAYRIEIFYRMTFVVAVVAAGSLGLSASHPEYGYVAAYVAYALLGPAMWMLSWSVVFIGHQRPPRVFGVVFASQYLALLLGFVIMKLWESLVGFQDYADTVGVLSLASLLILSCAYSFVLPERTLIALSPRLFDLDRASLDERCSEIATEYGLTEREYEIFTLLARGRDAAYIEKKLFISRNTVNTHRKNLYRKLGIHSQQDLLSLIERTLS